MYFPNELGLIHLKFYVSILKKCIEVTIFFIPLGLGVDESLSYEQILVEMLDQKV